MPYGHFSLVLNELVNSERLGTFNQALAVFVHPVIWKRLRRFQREMHASLVPLPRGGGFCFSAPLHP